MAMSRLALAAVVSLRAMLVYGEATIATSAELRWRDVLPAPRLRPRVPSAAAPPARVTAAARRYA